MKKLVMVVIMLLIFIVLAGCGGSYAYRRYESYGGDENSYWYFRWEQRSDHRRTDRRPPPVRFGTDIYHYGGRTEVKTAPPKDEQKKTIAVKRAEHRIRSAVNNKKRQ